MRMDDSERTCIDLLIQGLTSKLQIMNKLLALTKQQEEILKEEKFREADFASIIDQKEELLQRLSSEDEGFEQLYKKVSSKMHEKKDMFKPEILKMQELIKVITESGVLLKALETQNYIKFEQMVKDEKGRIRTYKANSKTASNYYKNMMKQSGDDTYFLDKKR